MVHFSPFPRFWVPSSGNLLPPESLPHTMKYDQTLVDKITTAYAAGTTPDALAAELQVPVRSIIAKLASLGVYKRKEYLNKRGEVPVKKEEYIERLAKLLNVELETLESLEKVNKNVLKLLESALTPE